MAQKTATRKDGHLIQWALMLPDDQRRERIRFDRNELSGAFGDIGTDFALVVGMILAGC